MSDVDKPDYNGDKDSDPSKGEGGNSGRHDRPDIDRPDPSKSGPSTDKLDASEQTRNDRATSVDREENRDDNDLFSELLETARNMVCRKAFNTTYRKTPEPPAKEDNRGSFEKVADWMGLDSFMGIEPPGSPGKFAKEFAEGVNDLMSSHEALVKESSAGGKAQNLAGRDKFWHAKANKDANSRGSGGQVAGALGSTAKEVKDVAKAMICRDWSYNSAIQDSMEDQVANRQGRDEGRALRGASGGLPSDGGVRNGFQMRLH